MAIINGTPAPDFLVGFPEDDIIRGFEGNDDLNGRGGNDFLDGGIGADFLFGRQGADVLFGNVGDDDLFGGLGRDTLRGGFGSDVFHFGANELGKANRDRIQDWDDAADFIDLSAFGVSRNQINAFQRGDDVLITIEDTNFSLILKNTDVGVIGPEDFIV